VTQTEGLSVEEVAEQVVHDWWENNPIMTSDPADLLELRIKLCAALLTERHKGQREGWEMAIEAALREVRISEEATKVNSAHKTKRRRMPLDHCIAALPFPEQQP